VSLHVGGLKGGFVGLKQADACMFFAAAIVTFCHQKTITTLDMVSTTVV
jgi:hypothetical protein